MNELEYEIYALSAENKDSFQRFFRQRRFEIILSELRKVAKKGDKILDIGCGSGIGTMQLSELGFDMTGSDINKKFVNYAITESKKRGLKTRFFLSDLTKNLQKFNNKFDVIIASEVLEHVEDYRTAIENLKKYLKMDGYLIVTVPNFHGLAGITEFLWSLKARYNWVHEHKHYICSPRRMDIILRNSGLTLLRIYTAFYISHFLPFVSKRLSSFFFEKEQLYMKNLGLGELLIAVAKNS